MKTINQFIQCIVTLSLLITSVSSCSDEFIKGVYIASANEYALSASLDQLQNLPAEGGVVKSRIEATNSVQWELQGLPSWCTTTKTKGTGSQDISFNVAENESFSSSRTHIFNLISTNQDWSISLPIAIIQQKKTQNFKVTPSDNASLTFDSKGGQKTLEINSNVAWKAECKESFLTMSQTAAQGDLNLVISTNAYDQIDITQNRTATIYFKKASDGNVLQVITVTQTPLHSSITTEQISVEFEKSKSSKVFTLGNIAGEYSVSSNAAWLNITKNRGQGVVDVTLSVEANDNDDDRTSKAYIFLADNSVMLYAFDVHQKGSLIELQPNSINFTANGGTQSVDVKSDSRWKVTNNNSWLTIQEGSSNCKFTATANNSLNPRSGIVEFNRLNDAGEKIGKTVSLNVTQEARHITPDARTIQFEPEASSKVLKIDCDANWTLTTNDAWIILSSRSGVGSASVNVSVDNNSLSRNRTGTINLNCLGNTIEIVIIQETAYVNPESYSIVFDAEGGITTLSLSSNVHWSAKSSESWLMCSPETGFGDNILTLTVPTNVSPERNAILSISSIISDMKVNIKQKAPTLEVSQNSLSFDEAGGTSEPIIVTTTFDYKAVASEPWISIKEQNNTFTITAKSNNLGSRTGTVIVSLLGVSGSIQQTITVSQKGDDAPYIDLGLTSGTLWCAYNKGATEIYESGNLYTMEETFPFNLPKEKQCRELVKQCTKKRVTINDVVGVQFTGPNGNTLFIPYTYVSFNESSFKLWAKFDTFEYDSYNDPVRCYFWLEQASWSNSYWYVYYYQKETKFPVRTVR